MAVGGIDYYGIGTGCHKGIDALHRVGCDAYTGSHTETAQAIFAGVGFIFSFGDVFICDKPHEVTFAVNHGELFYLMVLQNLGSLFKIGAL